MSPAHSRRPRGSLVILLGAAALLGAYGAATRHGPALADEYIYLAGARHFARTGSLLARYYDYLAILQQGHPHQDVHTPGYVLLLGGLMRAVGGLYSTAVSLNVVLYLAGAWLVRRLSLWVRPDDTTAWTAAALYLVLPAYLPYVYWAMPELLLGTLVLAVLTVAAWHGGRPAGAASAALLLVAAILVRESAIFVLPAVLALVRGWRQLLLMAASTVLLLAAFYVPLSSNRAEGGANFWAPHSGRAFGYQAVEAATRGNVAEALASFGKRVAGNARGLFGPDVPFTETGILSVFTLLPAVALFRSRRDDPPRRRLATALGAAWLAIVVLLFAVYVVVQWSGFRYLMLLMPAFLPWCGPDLARTGWRRWLVPSGLGLVCLALLAGTHGILTAYKASRQQRQERLTAYVEKYVGERRLERIALPNGWLYGLKHYPVETISSLPEEGGALRQLEQRIGFDVLVLPGPSPLREEWDGRLRYRRLNVSDPEPPLLIYQRVR